jgi:hypothetical protein
VTTQPPPWKAPAYAAGAWAVAAATALAIGAPAVGLGPEALADRFHDDAFYYFTIARHLSAGEGFTFDGIHATNGFHPLWLCLLVPIFRVVPGPFAPLRVVGLLEAVLVALAAAGIFRILRSRLGVAPALSSAALLMAQPGAARVVGVGMESSLLLAVLVSVWARWVEIEERPQAPPASGSCAPWPC